MPEDDRRDRGLQRERQTLDMAFNTGGELHGFVLEPCRRLGTDLKHVVMSMGHRQVEAEAMPPDDLRQIVREARGQDYRFSSIIEAIVTSTPFQMRRAE